MDFMQRISQTRNVTYFCHLHYTTLCFRKRRWRNLRNQSKLPLNSLKDQMNLNRIHNTPEKISNEVCRFNSGRDWKEGKIAFEEQRKPKQLFFADEDSSFLTESQFHPVSYFANHSPEIADNEEELSDSHSFDEQIHAMNKILAEMWETSLLK